MTRLPQAWLPVVLEAAQGTSDDLEQLKRFVRRHRDVIHREGGKAVAQLALQDGSSRCSVFDTLRAMPMQHLIEWRNKPEADPLLATLVLPSDVGMRCIAMSSTLIVGAAGSTVYIFDAKTEEEKGKVPGASKVTGLALVDTAAEGSGSSWSATRRAT